MKKRVELKKNVGAIVLAGGKSQRFGTNKALFPFRGVPLIQHIIQIIEQFTRNIILITNAPEEYHFINYPKYADLVLHAGPLGGIFTGLTYTTAHYNFIFPCDMPNISIQCLEYLWQNSNGNDITVPTHHNMLEPLCAIYAKSCLPFIEQQLKKGDYQIFQFYDLMRTKRIHFNESLAFYNENIFSNINTRQDIISLSSPNTTDNP